MGKVNGYTVTLVISNTEKTNYCLNGKAMFVKNVYEIKEKPCIFIQI